VRIHEDLFYDLILFGIKEPPDSLLGDVPVIRDLHPQRIVEVVDERSLLVFAEGIVESFDESLGIISRFSPVDGWSSKGSSSE